MEGMADARRTKIVATIGPASDSEATLRAMAAAGMDVARVPLAHGTLDDALSRIRRLREAAPEVGVMADLPGPKIRAAPFPEGGVELDSGSTLTLATVDDEKGSTDSCIGISHPGLVAGLEPGDAVALGDGGIVLRVERNVGDHAEATVPSAQLP